MTLSSSKVTWRIVTYKSPEGDLFEYLTNNFDLEPGVIAFLYFRRWDEEKCFDTWKNDFSLKKAWCKDTMGIYNQTLFAILTSVLLAIFMNKYQDKWQIGDKKALDKQNKRSNDILLDVYKDRKDKRCIRWLHSCYRHVSKISKQVIRFFKNCFHKKGTEKLYEKQLRPLLIKCICTSNNTWISKADCA